jgi:hypothetical protein
MNTTEGTSATAVGGSALSEGLGPLPEPRTLSRGDADGAIQLGYTAEQMRAYAMQERAAERTRLMDYVDKQAASEIERLRAGYDRYEVVRRMNVSAFQDAYVLNRRTGKPFDEIVAEQAHFYGLRVRA